MSGHGADASGMNQDSNGGLSNRVYVATVVSTADPKKLGRIRARVSEFFDDIPDEHLPWAIVSLSHPNGGSASHGRFEVPEEGTKVLVTFQDGNVLHPEYKGYFIDESTVLEEAKHNYPKRNVILWPDGTLFVLDRVDKSLYVRAQGALNIHVVGDTYMTHAGDVVQIIDGDRYTKVTGDDVTVVGGASKVYASSDMVLKAGGSQSLAAGSNQALYAGGTSTRDAGGIIHDDSGAGDSTGSAPAEPALPPWTSIRGDTP